MNSAGRYGVPIRSALSWCSIGPCCAITHGGMGTTLKALDPGVPVPVVPFARDQAEFARRVEIARL